MAYTSKKLIAQNLKKALHEYRALYENIAELSREEVMRTLPEGARKPAAGKILTEQHKQLFRDKGNELRSKALGELDEWRKEVNKAKAAAPSDEAVRAVQIFQQRDPKRMTRKEYQEEAQNIADAYGDNYLTYQALKDIAAQGGARLNPHPLVAEIENFDSVERSIKNFIDPWKTTNGTFGQDVPTAGSESFVAFFLDELMSD